MNKIILLLLLLLLPILTINATEYRLRHLKKGTQLNVRELPIVNSKTKVGSLPYNAVGIKIKHCKYNKKGREWCYISYPIGGQHIEGWVSRRFLKPMIEDITSKVYIQNFLRNYYMADEENFLDKLKVFYRFPMQQYFSKKNITHMQLRSKKVSFYKKWPKRDYQMIYMKILKRRDTYIDVQTSVRWNFKSRKDYESGKDIQKVRLVHDGDKFKVLAIKTLRHTVNPKRVEPEEEVLDPNTTVVSTTPLSGSGVGNYYIKVGSFFSKPNKKYLSNISSHGFNYVIKTIYQGSNVIRRVYIGPYSTDAEVIEALANVKREINQQAYIKTF